MLGAVGEFHEMTSFVAVVDIGSLRPTSAQATSGIGVE